MDKNYSNKILFQNHDCNKLFLTTTTIYYLIALCLVSHCKINNYRWEILTHHCTKSNITGSERTYTSKPGKETTRGKEIS